jgi:glycine/D-amino acid oxidase-like deaminating enzyme
LAPQLFRSPSFWHDTVGEEIAPRPPLDADLRADVAIVGAGYTGLWTAHYLSEHEPDCKIAIVESEVAGFGASGRNGGWLSSEYAGIDHFFEDPKTQKRALALQRAMFDAVDEVGRVVDAAGFSCDFAKGGMLELATCAAHEADHHESILKQRARGFGEDDFRWLDASECAQHVQVRGTRGGLYSPHCAAVQPAKLARGLANHVEARGVSIYEQSPARSIAKGEVVTSGGKILAPTVIRCTEGYTRTIPGFPRNLIPMHSSMIATEPLPDELWKEIGLSNRETFSDGRRIITYGQRTADGRMAFGTKGIYLYGSKIRDYFEDEDPYFEQVHRVLLDLIPALADAKITHRWGGALGITREWSPFIEFDPKTGLGSAGGYAGSGVGVANLAGRTLADLILHQETERTTYPSVNRPYRLWEPEPLRWLGVEGVRRMGDGADRRELRGQKAPVRSAIFDFFAGH